MIPPIVWTFLEAIPRLIGIGRKSVKAATEPDEEKVNPNAWSYKTTEHVRGQIDSATSFKVKSPHATQTPAETTESSQPETNEKKPLDPNPYSKP